MALHPVRNRIIHGDALEQLRRLPTHSCDSIVCDPPAGIGFMSSRERDWDKDKGGRDNWVNWLTDILAEARRVLKPGGHAFVWSIQRTSHWTAYALENAGFEIRDCVVHVTGEGMPKSHNVSKAIDRERGAKRKIVGISSNQRPAHRKGGAGFDKAIGGVETEIQITAPATPEAEQWNGWGTALKPAVETWWLARSPLEEKTVAANVLKHGTGAINIDASRVGNEPRINPPAGNRPGGNAYNMSANGMPQDAEVTQATGRWPANLMLSHSPDCRYVGEKQVRGNASGYDWEPSSNDNATHVQTNIKSGVHYGNETIAAYECTEDCPVRLLDEQSGRSHSHERHMRTRKGGIWKNNDIRTDRPLYVDEGGASRYFQNFYYCPKAKGAERDKGCDMLQPQSVGSLEGGQWRIDDVSARYRSVRKNTHPTVKPIKLMKYLIMMITPPGGIVLDMFGGSGTTAVAAIEAGFGYCIIEREAEYIDIIRARVTSAELDAA